MPSLEFQAGGKVLGGFHEIEEFGVAVTVQETVIGGTVTTPVSLDMLTEVTDLADITQSATVNTSPSLLFPSAPVTLSLAPEASNVTLNPTTGAVTLTGQISGVAAVYADGPTGRKKVVQPLTYVNGGSSTRMLRWRNVAQDGLVGGESLAYHINKTILDALEASLIAHPYDGSVAWKNTVRKPWAVNSYNPNAPDATLNPNRWFAAFDLSCMSCAQSNPVGSSAHPAILIGPRHCVTILHGSGPIGYAAGGKCTWRGTDGSYHSANIINRQNLGVLSTAQAADIAVCYLDAAIPAQVTPAKYLPSGFQAYIPSLSTDLSLSTISAIPRLLIATKQFTAGDYLNVQEAFWLHDPTPTAVGTSTEGASIAYRNFQVENPTAQKFADGVIGGDSGSPLFVWVNNQTVLLACHSFAGSSWMHSLYLPEITAAMRAGAQAAGDPAFATYAPQTVSLAGFKSTWP